MHHDDPADMPIDDRLEELAALLAAGFLRLERLPFLRRDEPARRSRRADQGSLPLLDI